MARKPLTFERQKDAERLKDAWNKFRESEKAQGRKVTQEDVSAACGWSTQGAFSAYLNGRTPLNLDALVKLSAYFNVSPSDISPELASTINSAVSLASDGFDNNAEVASIKALKRVPILTYVQAGNWRESIFLPADDYTFTSIDVSNQTFAAHVVGDSMLDEFKDGDLIIIDTKVNPAPTDFVFAQNDKGEITFKKYRSRGINENGVEVFDLVPLNPDFPIISSDRQKVEIIGTVVEHRRTFKKTARYH
ncbi:LexA family transcriptional regulator [Acinetobacter guillouiae]|uniref:LexA family transcriptional regulator n=1 Tax=Acinetobacter guillouiae TaxID=106649 RepID=UPI0033422F3E